MGAYFLWKMIQQMGQVTFSTIAGNLQTGGLLMIKFGSSLLSSISLRSKNLFIKIINWPEGLNSKLRQFLNADNLSGHDILFLSSLSIHMPSKNKSENSILFMKMKINHIVWLFKPFALFNAHDSLISELLHLPPTIFTSFWPVCGILQ